MVSFEQRHFGGESVTVLETFSSAFDFRAAQQQLEIVTGEDDPAIDFRFLPESPDLLRKRAQMAPEELAKTRLNLRGRLSNPTIRRALQSKNLAGYGIFFLTNVSDGIGRKKENIVAGRCLVLDLDGSPLPPAWVLEPHWIQETSPGRHQCFLAIEPTADLAGCEDVSRRLAAHYGGDLAVCDISHVFRLAGFYHLKRGRFPVRVVAQNDFDPRLKLADFEFLPRLPPKASVSTSTGPGIIDATKAELLFAEMDVTKLAGNQAWLDYAMSLHAASRGDPEVRDLFLDWCASDPNYAGEAFAVLNRTRWDSFKLDKPTLKGVGTLRKLCRAHGARDATLHTVFSDAAEDFDDGTDADFESSEDDSWMDGPAEPEPMLWDLNKANEMLADVESRMLRHGAPLYQSGGRLVYPVRSVRASTDEDAVRRPAGALTIHDVKSPRLTLFMIKHGRFVRQAKRTSGGEPQFVKQPANKNLAELYLSAPDQWNVPALIGIIETPTLRVDGTLLTEPGYDRQRACSLIWVARGFQPFPITRREMRRASRWSYLKSRLSIFRSCGTAVITRAQAGL
ncbi:MAG: DNA-primase RepB domain-containing protein [Burkholderiales bacterium]